MKTGSSLVTTHVTELKDMMLRNVTVTARRGRPVILLNNAGKMVASTNAVLGKILIIAELHSC